MIATTAREETAAATPRLRTIARLLLLGVSAWLIFISYPFAGVYAGSLDGIDTWIFALNHLWKSDYHYGQDWIFTYGPLGTLMFPMNIGSNLVLATAFWLVVHAVFAAAIFFVVLRTERLLQVLLFLVGLCVAAVLEPPVASEFLLVIALLLVISLGDGLAAVLASIALGPLIAVTVFVQLSIGAAAVAMVAMAGVLSLAQRSEFHRRITAVAITAAGFLATLLALTVVFIRSIDGFKYWITGSLNVISGYGVAMSLMGPARLVILGIAVLVTLVATAYFLWRTGDFAWVFAIAFTVAAFQRFKEGNIREDPGHLLLFFPAILGLAAVLAIAPRREMGLKIGSICLACVLALSLIAAWEVNLPIPQAAQSMLSGQVGWQNFQFLRNFGAFRQSLDSQSAATLQTYQLAPDWLQLLDGGSVDALPMDLNFIAANNLTWIPNPSLQSYSAYTIWLDQRMAGHFSSSGAPEFVIVKFEDIDYRNPILSNPALWRSLLSGYQVVRLDTNRQIMLLQRSSGSRDLGSLTSIGESSGQINSDVAAPFSTNLLFAQIDMQPNLPGRVAAMLFRIDPVYVELHYQSGRAVRFRITPETLRDGVIINYPSDSLERLAKLFAGTADERVTSLRIFGPGAWAFKSMFTIHWLMSSVPVSFAPAEPPSPATLAPAGLDSVADLNIINTRSPADYHGSVPVDSSTNPVVTVLGFAVDRQAQRAAGGVFATIDGNTDIPMEYGLSRPDVAAAFHNNDYDLTGFQGSFSTNGLSKGRHVLSFKVISADQTHYYLSDYRINLTIR
jgi:hypothetical protein